MNNPTKNGACNWANRVKASWKKFPPQFGKLIDMRVITEPGATCDTHILHMQYEHGHATFDGIRRVERIEQADPNAWAFENKLESF